MAWAVGRFFALVFLLSIPFWWAGAMMDRELLPGLPISSLMACCPVTAAAILRYREQGWAGASQLLRRALDGGRIRPKTWFLPIFGLYPAVMAASYAVMRWRGVALPEADMPLRQAPILFLGFLCGALGEELGWSGYAIERMQGQWSAFRSSIALGVVWAVWHFVPLMQAHRSASWMAWWTLSTVASRVILVWLYDATGGSVFAAACGHAISNLSWIMFPNEGSHYDPSITGPIEALAAALVTLAWRSRMLTSTGNGRARPATARP